MADRIEKQPQKYDVGQVVRDYTAALLHPEPNLATPHNLSLLLEKLRTLTDELERADRQRRKVPGFSTVVPCTFSDGLAIDQLCLDLVRWRRRLDAYWEHAKSVPAARRDDRGAVLWEISAPLLLGYHGGPTGAELPLVEGGFPPGFDTKIQHMPDLATPFSLANQLEVYRKFEQENFRRFLDDLGEGFQGAGDTAKGLGALLALGFGIIVGLKLLPRSRR